MVRSLFSFCISREGCPRWAPGSGELLGWIGGRIASLAPPDWYLSLDGWNLSREPEPSSWLRGSSGLFSRPRTGPLAAWLPKAGPLNCSLCQPATCPQFPPPSCLSSPHPPGVVPCYAPAGSNPHSLAWRSGPILLSIPPCLPLPSLLCRLPVPSLSATVSLTKFSCPSGSGTNVTSTLSHHPTQGELSPCKVLVWALINHLALHFLSPRGTRNF